MTLPKQLPLHFEFRANQSFNDFYAGSNLEVVTHLKNSLSTHGEKLIFIWGEAGLGKSHLLQACCHEAQNQALSSFYFSLDADRLPAADLLTDLETFEVVCFDNIEQIAGHKDWELAFFNFYNRHRALNHTLILSAKDAPNTIPLDLPDLKTRLAWGLALKIQPLSDEEKIAALICKAKQRGFEISPKAVQFLLSRYDRNLSSLWVLLAQLDHASLAAKRKITIPFLRQILSEQS